MILLIFAGKMQPFKHMEEQGSMKKEGFWSRVWHLYYDGFRSMTLGKTLWTVILVKLFIMFAILKVFFFPNFLSTHTDKGGEPEFVATELIDRSND